MNRYHLVKPINVFCDFHNIDFDLELIHELAKILRILLFCVRTSVKNFKHLSSACAASYYFASAETILSIIDDRILMLVPPEVYQSIYMLMSLFAFVFCI